MSQTPDDNAFEHGEVQFGTFYPKHYVVATFDSAEMAQAAAQSLASHKARAWTGEEILARDVQVQDSLNLFDKAARTLASDEEAHLTRFRAEATAGKHFVTALAKDDPEIESARAALRDQEPRIMLHYGEWTVTDLALK